MLFSPLQTLGILSGPSFFSFNGGGVGGGGERSREEQGVSRKPMSSLTTNQGGKVYLGALFLLLAGDPDFLMQIIYLLPGGQFCISGPQGVAAGIEKPI